MNSERFALEKIDANFKVTQAYLSFFSALALTKKKLEIAGMPPEEIDEFISDSKIRAKKLLSNYEMG